MSHRSPEATQYRRLYKTARWQRLRRVILAAEPLCQLCKTQGRVEPATVVDHIKPHKGRPDLFWDSNNLQSLCKACHDGPKQSEERRGYSKQVDVDGWPVDERHPVNGSA